MLRTPNRYVTGADAQRTPHTVAHRPDSLWRASAPRARWTDAVRILGLPPVALSGHNVPSVVCGASHSVIIDADEGNRYENAHAVDNRCSGHWTHRLDVWRASGVDRAYPSG